MRVTPSVCAVMIGILCAAPSARAQEDVGVSTSPHTVAPKIKIPDGQSPSCGPAPAAGQLNLVAQQARAMFGNPVGFNANWTRIANGPCPRNHGARYLIHLISNNQWGFAPGGAPSPGFTPGPLERCGKAAETAELNYVIGRMRTQFADPARFNANIQAISGGSCIASRATIYLISVMAQNRWSFRR